MKPSLMSCTISDQLLSKTGFTLCTLENINTLTHMHRHTNPPDMHLILVLLEEQFTP